MFWSVTRSLLFFVFCITINGIGLPGFSCDMMLDLRYKIYIIPTEYVRLGYLILLQ